MASRDGKPLDWFEIIDADEGGFVKADAQIDGSAVVLSAPEVKHPVAMRFAWSMLAEPNLMNADGLPAGAFRAGAVPKRDLLALKVPEARDYQLVYDLDLAKLGPNINYDVDNRAKIHAALRPHRLFPGTAASRRQHPVCVCLDGRLHQDLEKIGVPTFQVRRAFPAERREPERLFQRQRAL